MGLRTFARCGRQDAHRVIARSVSVRQSRQLSCSNSLGSGHNRWSKIKHDKGKNDKAKSQERNVLSYRVFLESKYGGPDPVFNSKLGIAIANAKRGQLAKPAIDAAIAKGQGKSISGAPLENVTVECMLPHGVAAIIEYLTETKMKVLQDVRVIINKNGGIVTPTSFLFQKKGKIWFQEKEGLGEDDVLEEAIEAGAIDVSTDEGKIVVETAPSDVSIVAEKLKEKLKLQVDRMEIVFDPNDESVVELSEDQSADVERVMDLIEDEPSLQNVYVNASSA